jgi:hypothetical protein
MDSGFVRNTQFFIKINLRNCASRWLLYKNSLASCKELGCSHRCLYVYWKRVARNATKQARMWQYVVRWRERTNKMQLIQRLLSNFLSQHVSRIIMPIITRIRPCLTACSVLPGCVGCGCLWSCGAGSCTVWKLLFDWSRTVTFTKCTQLTIQLNKTTANNSLRTWAEHRKQ